MSFVVVLCVVTFAPVFDNAFIADDYVFLQRVEGFKTDPLFLYDEAPLNYRMTTFLLFFLFKSMVGYTPIVFYAFTILLHAVNCLLLRKLLLLLGSDKVLAAIAALVFAVFHAPQEAVMWVVCMGECLLGFSVLAVLAAWLQKRYALALAVYFFALFTKEAAPLIWLLMLLLAWYRGDTVWSRPFLVLTLMTAAFCLFFIWMWADNRFIQEGAYDFGPAALRVLGISLHRLLWPWFHIALVLSILRHSWRCCLSATAAGIGLMVLTMSPYIFLTYADALPSRHLYLASMVFAGALATVLRQISPGLRQAFLAVFVVFNVGSVWVRKDQRFELRAAPTSALVTELGRLKPQPVLIRNFAYPYPEIAESAALAVSGWQQEFIVVEGEGVCEGCLSLTWQPESQTYRLSEGQ